MSRKTVETLVAVTLCGGLLIGGGMPANAISSVDDRGSISSLVDTKNLVYLSGSDLEKIGLTKQDAEKLTNDALNIIEKEKELGNISEEEAQAFSDALLTAPVDKGGAQVQALPVWAAAAIIGCAGSVALGEGRDQVKNALKAGKSVDETSDIVIGIAVDCVFGAIPGGAIGAAAKKSLTKPIKDTLRPHVKRIVADMEKRYREGKFR